MPEDNLELLDSGGSALRDTLRKALQITHVKIPFKLFKIVRTGC